MNIQVLAMLCSILTSPAACNRATAIDVVPLGTASSYQECMIYGQQTLASLALASDHDHGWVLKCESPTSIGKDHTA